MKNPLQTLVIAGIIAATTATAAFAGGNPQLMAQRNWEYFNQQKNSQSAKTNGTQQASDNVASPKASEYPCANCVYDHQAGGYVPRNIHTK